MSNYGYCRISRRTQNIERQIRNILAVCPDAKLYKEAYTGTKVDGRTELKKLREMVKTGDTIYFDSVSRMSRNAEDGIKLYMQLYEKGVELVFLKEPHINTQVYRKALENVVKMTGTDVDDVLQGLNKYLKKLATAQIRIAFEQAEKEVADLHQRTVEGIEIARRNGKQIGNVKGVKLNVKKARKAKAFIKKRNRDFGGDLNDIETMTLANISKPTFYKYKNEILQELSTDTGTTE